MATEFTVSARLVARSEEMRRGIAEGKAALASLGQQTQATSEQTERATAAQRRAATAVAGFAQATTALENGLVRTQAGLSRFENGVRRAEVTARAARAGMQQMSMQISDVSMQLSLGVNPAVVFGQQFGQIVQAMQLMRGESSRLISFLAGPWGAVLTGAVTVAGLLGARLLFASDSAQKATGSALDLASAADTLGRAHGLLGNFIDLTTGKQTNQNQVLREAIILQTRLAEVEAARAGREAGVRLAAMRPNEFIDRMGRGVGAGDVARFGTEFGSGEQVLGNAVRRNDAGVQAFNRLVQGFRADREASVTQFRQSLERLQAQGQLPGLDLNAAVREALTIAINRQEIRNMGEVRAVAQGAPLPSYLRRPGSPGRPDRGPAAPSTDARDEFGRDAAQRIAELRDRYSEIPPVVAQVNRATGSLDDLLEDIERRKPPNWEELLRQGRELRPVIESSINGPFRDLIAAQDESIRLLGLQATGRHDEAAVLQEILRLEKQMGPLQEDQKAQIAENVAQMRELRREAELLQQQQQLYLGTLDDIRGILADTTFGVLGGDMSSLRDLPGQLLESFNRLSAEHIVESLFGDAFRAIEDQITGQDQVRQSNERLARTGDQAARSIAKLGDAAESARTGMASTAQADALGEEIVINGRRGLPTNPREFFRQTVEGLLGGIVGDRFASILSRGISRGLEGAAIGSMVGGTMRSLGVRGSSLGGQIGGGIGNILGGQFLNGIGKSLGIAGGPLGSIIGGIAGNLLGAALGGTKRGSATITGIDSAIATRGNSSAFRGQASGVAGSVQQALAQIAEQLGGGVGNFAVSIGLRDGKFRVDPTGQGRTKTKKGAVDFGEDEAAAISFAIMDAIKDGAVTGLSAAVQQALRSSGDLDRAMKEALKVQQIEDLLSDLGGTMGRQFREFERQAADRVRIARQYGFDVVKIEEINAKERLKLTEDILASRIGSLRELLNDLSFGDLFEGSLSDRRSKLLEEIAKVRPDADAGVEGAADKLADLSRNLIELSREAFGTAGGEFAADRQLAISSAERVIELENERLRIAQDATRETNTQLNEANDHLSEHSTLLRQIAGALSGSSGAAALGGSSSITTRQTSLR
jgi:hypothetical protein